MRWPSGGFLLATTASDILPNTKNISIRRRCPRRKPSAAVSSWSPGFSYVDGQLVGSVSDIAASQGPFFRAAQNALMAQNDKKSQDCDASRPIAKREVTIMGRQEHAFSLLRNHALCSEAEYGKCPSPCRRRKGAT